MRSQDAFEIANAGTTMARTPVLAAGGIVLRQAQPPLIAVVRLRKRNEWVLPKGKLDDGETPRAAAEREVREETGHDAFVHEFLGTLVYESGGRSKVVHYWRMEAALEPAYELMNDVRAVDWLPLEAAVERLSRGYERVFLENVGPIALEAAALAVRAPRPRAKQLAAEKRRRRRPVAPPPSIVVPLPVLPPPDVVAVPETVDDGAVVVNEAIEAVTPAMACAIAPDAPPPAEPAFADATPAATVQDRRRSLIEKMRDWLRREV
jgi:8-oxo-dGTP diphosphatase